LTIITGDNILKNQSSAIQLDKADPSEKNSTIQKRKKCILTKRDENYYWKAAENERYLEFVRENIQWFRLTYKERVHVKINVLMSQAVGTRTAHQCHSHHQKMLRKVGSLEALFLCAEQRTRRGTRAAGADEEWRGDEQPSHRVLALRPSLD
jgi:hypothetical protein